MSKQRRILNEVAEANKNNHPKIKFEISQENLHGWNCSFKGPDNTPYQDLQFEGTLCLPNDFPSSRPTFVFSSKTIPYHINVDDSGVASVSLQWTPTLTGIVFVESVINMLETPQPTCSNFMLRSQNDSSEFITKLLQIIKLEKNHDLSFMDGELETRISCTNCGDIDQYVSPFIGQKVCVPYSQPLNSLLESFFLVSEPCSQCSGTFSTSQFFKGTIPHWLLFQFYYTEASTRVELDENELVCSLSVKEGECAEYDIKAMTLRCGGDLKYGHYVSAVFFNKGVRFLDGIFGLANQRHSS
ncbi:predicted protein [Naegleria gruberi]|uniref:Predicted protein n=1 Tax=Naegleria gruberi TaxID=5762 RepID=D2V1Y1_NAEGR|nr:uncharacterized protein NAEGRDRAFT_62735 [Naegleria gruberi]EFC49239.1 predicted protein [Naegleria gruberi]|eukprot:XP_002681983.1 predicted protein [Naegleria gruberi strain NEG-M]